MRPLLLDQLPVDIQCRILHELDRFSKYGEKRSLASVQTRPLHRSIHITDSLRDKHARAIRLALHQHGRHLIEELTFSFRRTILEGNLQNHALEVGKPGLSTAAQELLDGSHTPNLRRVNVDFDSDLKGEAGSDKYERDIIEAFGQPKDEEALLQLECDQPWRRLVADTWAALAANSKVAHLSLNRFVPIWTSALHLTEFREFLGRLEQLDIHISALKSGHRSINTVPAYIDSLQSMLKVFFLHATSLEKLTLKAAQDAPLGARGHYHIPLSLKATQLPRLQYLGLKNCFIGFELAHFINGHSPTLETLELHNCYSFRGTGDGGGGSASGMCWAPFLAMITRPGMRLRRLEILDEHIPLTIDDKRLAKYDADTADEPDDVRNVRRAQQRNSKLRLFLYAYLRDYSGELWMNKEGIVAAFEAGDDQCAFDKLMLVVRRNAEGPVGEELEEHVVVAGSGPPVNDSEGDS